MSNGYASKVTAALYAQQAMKQIEDNKYHEPYLSLDKKIILFGVGFLDKKLDSKVKILNN